MVSLVKHDLEFILKQIKTAEEHTAGTPLTDLVSHDLLPYGLRTVDGSYNNLGTGNELFGSSSQIMPRLLNPVFNPAEARPANLHPGVPAGPQTSYAQNSGSVYDSQPRIISNLVLDQTIGNPATVIAALVALGHEDPYAILGVPANSVAYQAAVSAYEVAELAQKNLVVAQVSGDATIIAFAQQVVDQANAAKESAFETFSNLTGVTFEGDTVFIPNVSADLGDTAPFNSFFTLFGQFFDHGLDLVSKGGSGTVYIPLQPDDPLYVPGSPTNFMVLTRATNQPGEDGVLGTADDVHEHANETTPWVDLNQVYTSNPSHQAFLREYVLVEGKPVATGRMLEGANGGPPTWADIKAQAANLLGIELTDADVLRVPAVLTDLYGEFTRDADGMLQLVTAAGPISGNLAEPVAASQAVSAGRAFLNDIAHNAVPVLVDHDANPSTPQVLASDADSDTGNSVAVDARGNNTAYDNELLDRHYIVGDGRGNENIGLTSVHHLFHNEHNRQIEEIKHTIVETGDLAFLNEWLAVDVAAIPATQAGIDALIWDGERLFQAGRFSTEMVYQHLVFEEFARAVAPNIDAFLFSNTVDIDPAIVAEFAHVVYRFGHSMLTENIDRLNLLLGTEGGEATGVEMDNIGLIDAFLNPVAYAASGVDSEAAAGAILRGMSRQVGNEIDEFLTDALRNNLVGLPLDLATVNMTRARETGVPSLNAARREFYAETQDTYLKPYESWFEFALAIKNPASLVNFIAAYGTHATILAATTVEAKRDAAMLLVLGGTGSPADRLDFLNSTGAWANGPNGVTITGLDTVDFWIGGIAEKKMAFGGMLGSTFTFVFENQLEKLQEGDRFYYLSRTQGLNLLNELESDSFAELVMRNTDTGESGIHMNGMAFQTADYIFEMDPSRQYNAGLGSADPTHANPILQAISPMVIRQDLDGDGDFDLLRFTGGEHVVLGGTSEDDTLIGGEGDDTLWGGDGNDRLEGGFGVDHIHGGAGHDIITDSGTDVGAADVLDGEDGDDFINGGMGLDLIFGGRGSDFIYGGSDDKIISGGQGNDFIGGPSGLSSLMGNEGDDWIEGGDSFDTLAGENSELFFNSTIIGHDVLDGRGNDTDYDAESGDDIMFQGPGIQRNNGMAGFDWAIHKGNPEAADSDMTIKIFENQQNNILRDRFDLVEGLSGWMHDDILIGRQEVMGAFDDGENAAQVDPNAPLDSYSNALLEKNVHLIDGLDVLVDHLARTQVTVAGVTETIVMDTSDASDIILGGGGSDTIRGNAGNDIIDGDAWLNACILVSPDASRGQTWAPFSIDSLDQVQARVASDEIRGSQMQIVREILYSNSPDDIDTAVFSGVFANYTVMQLEGGAVIVTDNVGTEGSDRLTHIERLQFADQTITLSGSNSLPNGQLQILDNATEQLVFAPAEDQVLRVSASLITDADGIAGPISFQWQMEEDPGTGVFIDIINATGATFTPGDDQVGLVIRVVGSYTDGAGVVEQVISWSTDPVANENDAPTGVVELSDVTPTENRALIALTNQIADIDGLEGATFTFQWQQSVDGATWIDIPGATDQAFVPEQAQVGLQLRVVVSYVDDGGTTETLTSLATGVVGGLFFGTNAPNTLTGTAGQDEIYGEGGNDVLDGGAGNDIIEGGAGADTITGGDGNDVLTGGQGSDSVDGGLGNDLIVYTFGDGADLIVNGGDGTDTLEITGTSGNDTLNVSFDGAAIAVFEGGNLLSVEAIHANLLDGVDTLTYAGTTANVSVNLGTSTASGFASIAGIENVTGGTGADTLTGNAAANALNGGGGNDTLLGGLGNDTLTGGGGNDTASYAGETDAFFVDLGTVPGTARRGTADAAVEDALTTIENVTGGSGNDTIAGSAAANILNGGSGNDTLTGLGGADTLIGGLGDDDIRGGVANDTIDAGAGSDAIRWAVGDGRDVIRGGAGEADTFFVTGNTANEIFRVETVAVYLARTSADPATLQADTEIVVTRNAAVVAEFNGIDDVEIDGGGGTDQFVFNGDFSGTDLDLNTVTFRGSGGNDTLNVSGRTSDHRVVFVSNGGNDTIIGQFRNTDVLELDAATLAGTPALTHNQNGTSTLQSETCQITAATETPFFSTFNTPPPAEEPPAETVPLSGTNNRDHLQGTDEADHILGLRGDDKLYGRDGDDLIDGGTGEDRMSGGEGDDTYIVDDRDDRVIEGRGEGTDTVETTLTSCSLGRSLENLEYTGSLDFRGKGNDADNAMTGGAGNDRLEGRDGDDVITGGAGNDRMWGGDDSDTFVFAAGFGNDRIYDFDADPRRGQDMLDLSDLGVTAGTFEGLVDIDVNCGDTVITIGGDSITLLGVNGRGSNAITQADFIL